MTAVFLVALPLDTTVVAAQTSDEGIKKVGTLARYPTDVVAVFGEDIEPYFSGDERDNVAGTLIAIPRLRQLWQVYLTRTLGTAVAVRDMDSLKLVHTFSVPVVISRGNDQMPSAHWLHALDGDRRIFLAGKDLTRGHRVIRQVVEVDLKTFAWRSFDVGAPFTVVRDTQAYAPGLLEYDPYDDDLLLLFGGPSIGISPTTFVHRIDLGTRSTSTRQLRTCTGELPSVGGISGGLGGIVTRDHVFFPCQRQGNIGAVVKVNRSDLFGTDATGMVAPSDEEFVAGPGFLETAIADPVGGRIFLVTWSGEIWAFDIATSSFVGVVAGGVEGQTRLGAGLGIDEVTGRLFLQSEHLGIGIAEGRFYPIPQARTFPQYKKVGQERIVSDAKNNRIFVLTGTWDGRPAVHTIFDVGPAPVPPPPPDPDRNTIDVEEQPGVTDVRYFASGTGYGVRTVLGKGIAAVPPAPAIGITSPTGQIIADNINSKCGFTDRELSVGRVSKAEYDTGSSSAQAIGVDVDERTKLDIANPSRCDVTATSSGRGFTGIFSTHPFVDPHTRDLENGDSVVEKGLNDNGVPFEHPERPTWDRQPASCSSSAGEESGEEGNSRNETNSKAHVECPLPGQKLVATATGYLTGAVSVGRAETVTEIQRDGRSVVSRVVSEAQDIDIAGVIKIGRITAVAESKANGRPRKGDMSEHTITIQGVRIGETVVCTNNCDKDEVIRRLNLAANGRAEFRSASGRDEQLLKGSPKGASTAVQKSVARQTSDRALTGDSSNELAALEMIVYNDNPEFGRARQVFQFAGVATAATYNIALLPTGPGFDDLDDDDFDDDDFQDVFGPGGSEIDDFLPGVDSLPRVPVGSFSEGAGGSVIERVVRAVARGIRMFFTNPRHALLLLTAWSLFSLPGVLARRRRLLALARSQ